MDVEHESTEQEPGATPDWNRLLQAAPELNGLSSPRLAGMRVLITGAGGSIGSALAQAAWSSAVRSLVLLDTSESGLYRIDRTLREGGSCVHHPVLGSVVEGDRLARLFATYRPQIVFHAAALKHVPLMELNPFAAVETNALGTFRLATAAAQHGVEDLILVSTDKAVEPRSMMGASKRVAELVLLVLGADGATRMTAIRLGNVLGSQGSVLPLFLDQMARGGPLTVTHPEAERFFMTMDAAVAALLAGLGVEGSPAVFVPELGDPVRVLDLAHHLLASRQGRAKIEITGLRPGDKLSESLLSSEERWVEPSICGLRRVCISFHSRDVMTRAIEALEDAVRRRDLRALVDRIAVLVPKYEPSDVIRAALVAQSKVVR